ncbi:MAG: peroxiredoxin family protein [Chloroflexota bacterium]|nr:peroxiredoxin family protein [Chloroflexota bacterium]
MSNSHYPQHLSQPSLPETDQIIPAFTLPGADGMPHSPWTYKQRENLLLLFTRSTTSSETRGLLRAFAQKYRLFREEMCATLAITPDTVIINLQAQEELQLPFPLLADPSGDAIARYTSWKGTLKSLTPSIVLADRYNALYQQWQAENEANLPPIEEILESLRYMNRLCTP